MKEERRVRFTDEYVPGPKGCPVFGIEFRKVYSLPVYVRANTKEEAQEIAYKYYEEHFDDMEEDIMNSDPVADDTIWLHLGADQGWNK